MSNADTADFDDDERARRISQIVAVMPAIDDPVPTESELEEVVRRGPPRFLYHSTDSRRRSQISDEGLLLRHSETAELAREMGEPEWWTFGGIFFSTVIHAITPEEDVWILDTSAMSWAASESDAAPEDLAPDFSVDPANWAEGEIWWHVRCDIPPEAIRLHELCYPQAPSLSMGPQ